MKFDKDEIKNSLDIFQVSALLDDMGGEPIIEGDIIKSRTICHCGESHKLYYYNNTKLFKCYTDCSDTVDIFDLVTKVKSRDFDNWSLYKSIKYVVDFFSLSIDKNDNFLEKNKIHDYIKYLDKIIEKEKPATKKSIELKVYEDNGLIDRLIKSDDITLPWESEGITKESMSNHNIHFYPSNYSIIIPHYNEFNQLVGIRERTMIKENEIYGKYRPAIICGRQYNHPLGFNLYNLNMSKNNIKELGIAIVFEGEKSCLLYSSYVGQENDITVATCGSSFTEHQFQLLKNNGAKEIVIAFDRQFEEHGDKNWKKWTKKLESFHNKYGGEVQISYIHDHLNLLGFKESPIDRGLDIFLKLFNNRIRL